MVKELTLYECLENYCRANSLTIEVKNLYYFSKHERRYRAIISNLDFFALNKIISKEYPSIMLYYDLDHNQLVDVKFSSKKELSHFLLSWS